jgi:hypothetical protein
MRRENQHMDWSYITLITSVFSILLIITQRVVATRRHLMRGFVISMAILLMIRYELQVENLVGYGIALFVSFLFWLLIGRYNPVGDDSGIKVYGMDD